MGIPEVQDRNHVRRETGVLAFDMNNNKGALRGYVHRAELQILCAVRDKD